MTATERANIEKLLHIAISTDNESKRQRLINRITWKLETSKQGFVAKVVLK